MSALITAEELADRFGISIDKLHEVRRAKNWPHVRLTRFDFRFTAEQVEQIIAMQSVTPPKAAPRPVIEGQTARSAGRRSA